MVVHANTTLSKWLLPGIVRKECPKDYHTTAPLMLTEQFSIDSCSCVKQFIFPHACNFNFYSNVEMRTVMQHEVPKMIHIWERHENISSLFPTKIHNKLSISDSTKTRRLARYM
jgi:hypothetical protein